MTQLTPLLDIQQLEVTFPDHPAVQGLSLRLHSGEIVALVGESGSGKSVSARALVGLAGDNARVQASKARLYNAKGETRDLLKLSAKAWQQVRGGEIGFVLQDALTSLDPLKTIGAEVAEALCRHQKIPRREVAARVEQLLEDVGIPDARQRMDQYAHELSGGLRQRALIASALAGGPTLLIADEPTTALDVTVQQRILSLFRQLADRGHGVLLITHDLAVVAKIADRVLVMRHGRVVEQGETAALLAAPQHPYTRQLLAAIPGVHTRNQWLADPSTDQLNITPRVDRQKRLLSVQQLHLAFRRPDGSRHQVLDDISFQLRHGETLGLVGESGSGKTSLGKVILGLVNAQQGEVWLEDQRWSHMNEADRRPLRQRIQTISQDPLGAFNPLYTVMQIVQQPLRLQANASAEKITARTEALMQQVGLPLALLSRRPAALSGGQRQRVAIAQALASDPEILICDEPVSALDVLTQAQILDLLRRLQIQLGLSMLFISHDPGVVLHMSHRVAVLSAGKIVEVVDTTHPRPTAENNYSRQLLFSGG
ncbi:ATP-binding cassette domain-containing protein [Pantoea sp. A4]|uniref:ATP-binding cassette domain-containing protein n=1 Tax=Pantoea sp. A4 TaxID=1225184 RepID=UPI000376468E|nr:ABC transporter ATP-binding protein [Pantoea sp. A4]